MFCKNCGKEIDPNAAICVNCGYQKGAGNRFCANCGQEIVPGASVCMHCGFAVQNQPVVDPNMQKSKMAAGLLGIFLGGLGVHNFYLGYTGKAVAQLLIALFTCGVGAIVTEIWGLVEGIMILTGNINVDGKGVPLKD